MKIDGRKDRGIRRTGASMVLLMALQAAGCGTRPDEEGSGAIPPPDFPEVPVSASAPARDDRIRVGDRLEIFVEEARGYDGIYHVREGGDIILSGVGRVPVEGLSVSGAKDAIERALENKQLKQATLIVDRVARADSRDPGAGALAPAGGAAGAQRSIAVYLTGKVNRPGQHLLRMQGDKPIGVYDALLMSGGLSRFADNEKVHILRSGPDGKKHKIPVNVRRIEAGEIADVPVGQGDIIVVPEKVFGF